ncbi:MAG: bacteriohemerythrin [Pseudomonadota bacterium]
MKKRTLKILKGLLIGLLVVATILTTVSLGIGSPVPWVLAILVVAISAYDKLCDKHKYISWKDEYSVGIKTIDQEHQKLLGLINQFLTASQHHTSTFYEQEAMEELIDYTNYHFRHEEELMEKHDYPGLEAHKQEHRKMVARVNELVEDYNIRGQAALEDTAGYLKHWLINHIQIVDQQYSDYLRKHGAL